MWNSELQFFLNASLKSLIFMNRTHCWAAECTCTIYIHTDRQILSIQCNITFLEHYHHHKNDKLRNIVWRDGVHLITWKIEEVQ